MANMALFRARFNHNTKEIFLANQIARSCQPIRVMGAVTHFSGNQFF